MPQFPKFKAVLIIATGAVLTACGGSSGGSGPPAPPAPPAPQLATITAANAEPIAAAVYQTVITTDDVAGLTNPLASGGSSTANAKSSSSVAAIDPNGEVGDCSVLGRFSVTISDAVIDNLIAGILVDGDRFAFGFEDCDDGEGFITDGSFEILVTDFDGDILTELYLLEADVTMTDFALTFNNETNTLNANMSIGLDLLSFPVATITVSGGNIDESGPNGVTSLSDFIIATTFDESNPNIAVQTTGSGALTTSDFDGEVMFNITTILRNIDGQNPTEGVIVISGANGASITITALSETEAQLEIDLGDGSAVETRIINWSDLLPLT